MKKINLKLSVLFLICIFQISFFSSLNSNTNIENSQEVFYCVTNDQRKTNGIEIISPENGEEIKGSTTIRWLFSYPYSSAEVILSNVYYSPDLGTNWIQIAYNSPDSTYEWNTSLYEEYGSDFKIRITASSKDWIVDLQVISEGSFTIDNRGTGSYWYLYLIFSLLLIIVGSISGLFLYRFRLRKKHSVDLHKMDQTEKIKDLSQKVIVGLDNIKDIRGWSSKISITTGEVITNDNGSIVQYFSKPFQNELKSEIIGRTVIVLIEIAFQNPSETNPMKIAKGVGIPPSTLSKELKKLNTLEYIESHISKHVLSDARYRNYRITKKGFEFLNILNIVLKDTIQKVKTRNESSFSI